jgi:hypothetical protein
MPTIDLTDDEYAAVTAAIRHAIETDRFPSPAPRSAARRWQSSTRRPKLTPEPPLPKTPGPREAANGRREAKSGERLAPMERMVALVGGLIRRSSLFALCEIARSFQSGLLFGALGQTFIIR